MRQLLILIVLAGCATDDLDDTAEVLGSGTLTYVGWSAGLCPRSFTCAGELTLTDPQFVATFDTTAIANGNLAEGTSSMIDQFVAAIPIDQPVGVFTPDGGDSGKVEMRVEHEGELRTYFTNGFRGDFGLYVWNIIDAVATCQTGYATYDSCTPQK
jgi:hypothetical protein